ncbi:hypothetical protein [Deinococcus roseus]|uniref:Uncharacterized protein n=1 Tax=Deinococcus roseus TaxID=392414 RepID=A0ABQ2DD76_9DEIO|nr:hypothetical protein [Deinococcus roseus]GGJ50475.1 hypothetical protein GCM10008938_40490 [Deinococcus roseus]
MTGQAHDRVLFQGKDFLLGAVAGTGLFDLQQMGLRAFPASTACWRGFQVTYAIEDGFLMLDSLVATFPDPAPLILGQAPHTLSSPHPCGRLQYHLHQPTPFTGRLRILHDLIRPLYVHGGFQEDWKFNEVHLLHIEHGRILSSRDCSQDMAKVREMLREKKPGAVLTPQEHKVLQAYQALQDLP